MNYTKLRQIKKLYFGYEDISRAFGIGLQSAKVACARFVKSGIIVRAKRNSYLLKEKWDALTREDKFILANLIQAPSYISLMSALDYYEITTQIQQNFIESVAIYRTKQAQIEDDTFNYTKIAKELYFNFIKEKGFFIATPEKAFLDALYLMSLKRYSFDLTSVDVSKLGASKIKKILKKYPSRTRKILKNYAYLKKA